MKKIISILAAIAIMSTSSPALIGGAENYDTTSYETVAMDVAGALAQPTWKDPAVGVTALRVKWNKVSGASGYRVYRLIGGKWTKVATLRGAGTTQYRDGGLASATEYSYKVKAYRKTSHGTKWSKASAKLTATTKPKQVKISSCGATETAIRLNWQATSCDGYLVYQKQSDGSFERIAKLGSDETTYRVDGLSEGTKYTFKMRAYKRTPSGLIFGSCASKTKTTKEKEIVWTDVDKAYYHMACGYPTAEQCELVRKDIVNYILDNYSNEKVLYEDITAYRVWHTVGCGSFNPATLKFETEPTGSKYQVSDAHCDHSIEMNDLGVIPKKNGYTKENYEAIQEAKQKIYYELGYDALFNSWLSDGGTEDCPMYFNIGIELNLDSVVYIDDEVDYYDEPGKDPWHIPQYTLWFCCQPF